MRLRIIDVNFYNTKDWIFKLVDENENECYIMDSPFYKALRLRIPITKHESDYYDKGLLVSAEVTVINERRIVTAIYND